MTRLQRISFPETPETLGLFFNMGPGCVIDQRTCIFEKDSVCSLDSFYNSFFWGDGGWPDSLGTVACRLYLNGDFCISTFSRHVDGSEILVDEHVFENCNWDIPVEIPIPVMGGTAHRLYPVLRSTKKGGSLGGGEYICTHTVPPVRVALVICTYLRENAVIANLEKLTNDNDLKSLHIVVVDNGKTLDSSQIPNQVQLIPNDNTGGAGGFSRGLLELSRQKKFTHVILMDDDLMVDSEAVFRSTRYFAFSPQTALAGALLSIDNPAQVVEAGAKLHPAKPLAVIPQMSGLGLDAARTLDQWQGIKNFDYGGFWFFGFPLDAVHKTGALLPYFIKGDDVEFGLRLLRLRIPMKLLAGVGGHHPDFTSSFDVIKRYYWVRNMVVSHILHSRSLIWLIKGLMVESLKEYRAKRREFLLTLSKGLEDVRRGPEWMEQVDNQALMLSLKLETRKRYPLGVLWMRCLKNICWLLFFGILLKRDWAVAKKRIASLDYW